MNVKKENYFKSLSKKDLSHSTIEKIINEISEYGLNFSPINPNIIKKNKLGAKITEKLTRLDLYSVEGNSSWEGLAIGFPGNKIDLSTKSIGTPYLRMILYPILDLHHRLQNQSGKKLPCVYLIGERFSDVFLRKYRLLSNVIPHVIVLTNDIYKCAQNKSIPITTDKIYSESWTQMQLCQKMNCRNGLVIHSKTKSLNLKFLSYEVPCSEGTENPERLDILGYCNIDHSLVAFELKGPKASRVELENLFLQGIEHRNWIEKNKMAVKLLFDGGPKGKRINTRKRVRLLLGFYGENIPQLFFELRKQAKRRDKYASIDFVKLSIVNDDVTIGSIE